MAKEEKRKMKKPNIVISKVDVARLEKILDNLSIDQFPHVDELVEELNRAKVVEPTKVPKNVVTMNSTVRFKILSTNKEFCMTLVYPNGVDGDSKKVSILAPVGSALLGLKEGHSISWPKPGGGNLEVEIIEVTYQPEREGDFHL
jgi:regulator of nucleoside diphosphate kinase